MVKDEKNGSELQLSLASNRTNQMMASFQMFPPQSCAVHGVYDS